MGNRWSTGRRHTSTAQKNSEGIAQTGWNSSKTSTIVPHNSPITDLSSPVSQPRDDLPAEDDLNGIIIYRSYSHATPPEAETELQPSRSLSAGVRFETRMHFIRLLRVRFLTVTVSGK